VGEAADQLPRPDEAHCQAARILLAPIWPAPGQVQYGAIDLAVRAYKQSDVATQYAVIWLCLTSIRDKTLALPDRWPCCYVIGRCGYMRGVPDLIDVMLHDEEEAMRAPAAEALGEMYESTGKATIRDALLEARKTDRSKRVRDAIDRHLKRIAAPVAPVTHVAPVPNPPDGVHRRSADALLRRIWSAEPGKPKFDAIDAVVEEYMRSDAATQHAVIWLCLTYIKDKGRTLPDRWPCCYVIDRSMYVQAMPDLIDVLLYDEAETMRAVAAEALGEMYKSTTSATIREALLRAAQLDKSKWVRDTIAKYVGRDMPAGASQ